MSVTKYWVLSIFLRESEPRWNVYKSKYPIQTLKKYFPDLNESELGDDDLNEVLYTTIESISQSYFNGDARAVDFSTGTEIDIEFDVATLSTPGKTLADQLAEEYDNQQKIINVIKGLIKEILDAATIYPRDKEKKSYLPDKPVVEITEDKNDSTVNTYFGGGNGGGWSLEYELMPNPPIVAATASSTGVTTAASASNVASAPTPLPIGQTGSNPQNVYTNEKGEKVEVVSPLHTPIGGTPSITTVTPAGTQSTPTTPPPSTLGSTQSVANPQTGVVEQEKSRGEKKGQEGDSSNAKTQKTIPSTKFITQLVEPKLKAKTIKVSMPSDEKAKKEIAQSLGNFPVVWYNAYQILYSDIEFFQLYNSGNIPTLKISFSDSYGKMKDEGFPLDDTKISVFINPRTEQLKPIHMDFKIAKFSIDEGTYNITGVIDAPQLYVKKFKSVSSKTSFEALKSIAEEIELGFASNVDSTDDSMVWISPGLKLFEFIDNIVNNSYKSDQSYLTYYIDFYYNLTYVEVEKELTRNISQELGVGNMGIEEIVKLDKDVVQRLFLTNNKSFSNSNSYFSKYRIINNSTSISLREGYWTKVKFYDQVKKDFLVFNLESITTDPDNSILMKGLPQDEKFYKENTELIYLGKLDEDNMYNNYHYANIQNYRNLIELEKIGLEITMKTPNYNFYRYQKVLLNLSNQTPTPAQSTFNNRLSGEWLIVDIVYRFDGKVYEQIIKLVRKELSLSPEEKNKESKPKKKKDSTRGKSTNPDPGTEPNPEQATAESVGASDSQAGDNVPAGGVGTVEGGEMSFAVPPPPSGNLFSSPSKYPLKEGSFIKRERKPTQFVLHYSAGWQTTDKCAGCTAFVSGTRGLTYHYIISVEGHIENLVDPKYIAAHAGDPPNANSIGISLECLGTTFSPDGLAGANKQLDRFRKSTNTWKKTFYGKNQDYVNLVDADGVKKSYKGFAIGQEVSVQQIAALRGLMKSLAKRFPTIPSWNGLNSENFDILFPPKGTTYKYNVPGLYTHCSITTQKSDILPTPRLVNFLKTLRY